MRSVPASISRTGRSSNGSNTDTRAEPSPRGCIPGDARPSYRLLAGITCAVRGGQ
ncbi:hypothetical protein CCC_00603 [Paramagnetospirillum magnetotacticum MS-1]|uniref:Uncharacterized protein n=1 Tax=Paramagnetospirillum magnetotacticum MS-1 TaxID=272627 RepID=A0A0C2U7T7_PARME|nr:hypothetical protein CCC_00603 [Paramagnetospirillum magnetotacticum MS-1]